MDEQIERLRREISGETAGSGARSAALRALLDELLELAIADTDDRDLRVAANSLRELLEASRVFSPWRDRPKLTVFGSARAKPDSMLYQMAIELSREMAERGWMTVSGAGPGIMEAAARGAGLDNTLGVNIDLPFEQSSNPYVDAETRLVEMKYFFTRKVALTKESLAFAIFPGGLGTMDEAFEVLTLLHTGKSNSAPVLLVDSAEGMFWERWQSFIDEAVVAGGYLDADARCLFKVCHSVEATIDAIEHFYVNYVSFDLEDTVGSIQLRHAPTRAQLVQLASQVPSLDGEPYEVVDESRVTFRFDGRNYVYLRRLIDALNQLVC